jgi:phage shock protein A
MKDHWRKLMKWMDQTSVAGAHTQQLAVLTQQNQNIASHLAALRHRTDELEKQVAQLRTALTAKEKAPPEVKRARNWKEVQAFTNEGETVDADR